MPFAIGLRFYRIHVHKNNDRTPIKFAAGEEGDPYKFLSDFVSARTSPTEEVQRSWFFTPKPSALRTIHGVVNYGTHGFESKLIDVKTKKHNYQRKATDLEEIPLYFQFWLPEGERYGFAAFQSFQGRSCINFITKAADEAYAKAFKGHRLAFHKLLAGDLRDGGLGSAPVKELRLLKRDVPKDKADKYLNGTSLDEVEYEVTLRAKRRRSLGIFNDFKRMAGKGQKPAVFTMDGVDFDEVKANVEFAGRRRMVGIFGSGTDAGVIEVSDKVARGSDGHPVFQSIADEVDELMETFFDAVNG
ncbi:hypothetical protein ABID21_001903 [Pseudorhizobium tarimense]|uniref:Uncharacterized protein n=1 Tax=Pseudorhizobium tarimense TaxID=1079109 RepID=A0ABV2H5G1_9HYPH|nr:hypothetical protein [Pseudorhizobium tarimense]MCJ8518997.1 hypothetical protein [Pseudorhizobium tarimense]